MSNWKSIPLDRYFCIITQRWKCRPLRESLGPNDLVPQLMNFLVYGLRYWLSSIKDDKSNEFFFWLLCWNAGMFLLLFVCLFFGPFTFLSFDYSVKKRESRPQRKPSFKRLRAEGVPALIHWSIDWLIDWLIDLFIYLFVRSFVRSFIYLFIYLFIYYGF